MTTKVSGDFKAAFALILSIQKVNFGIDPAMNYSQTVYEWTLGGLITEGIVKPAFNDNKWVLEGNGANGKEYVKAFAYAEIKYKKAVELIQTQATSGRKAWVQSQILDNCFDINKVIFPIALAEGLLDLKDVAAGIGAGAGAVPVSRDGQQR